MPDAVLLCDEAGVVRWASTQGHQVFGPVIGASFPFEESTDPVAVTGADGRTRWLRILRRTAESIPGFLVVAQDVTERVEAQQRYDELVGNSSDVVYRRDLDGIVEWVTPSVTAALGWDPQELVGRPIDRLIVPEDMTAVRTVREQVAAGQQGVTGLLVRFLATDGRIVTMSSVSNPVYDGQGQVVGAMVGLRDVSDLIEAQHESERHWKMLQATLDSELDPHVAVEAIRDGTGGIVDFVCIEVNDAACRWLGKDAEVLRGARVSDVVPAFLHEALTRTWRQVFESGEPLLMDDVRYRAPSAEHARRFDVRTVPFGERLSHTWRDVTERYEARVALEESERRFRMIAENTLDVVIKTDLGVGISWVSPSVTEVLGWEPQEMLGTSPGQWIHPDDMVAMREAQTSLLEQGAARGVVEVRYRTKAGDWRWMRGIGRIQFDEAGNPVGGIDTLREIEAEMDVRSRLAFQTHHDPLTGLGNQAWLVHAIEGALQGHGHVAVLAVGVDDLELINTAFTRQAGDRVLLTVAGRLVDAVGTRGQVASTGQNEFGVLVEGRSVVALADLAAELHEACRGAVTLGAQDIAVSASIGIATAGDGADPDALLSDAMSALHQARQAGGNRWEFLDHKVQQAARDRMLVQSGLREAIDAGQIQAWFQPLVSLSDGSVQGHEALARWVRPDGEVVAPAEFLPIAEQTDLIVLIDHAILEQALAALQRLPAHQSIGANVSAATLSDPGLIVVLRRALARHAADPARLHLEVTETSLIEVSRDVLDTMDQIGRMGVTWWVDDFGTGYSSISHLRDMPIKGLKIDRSFTSRIDRGDERRTRLAQGLLGLAQGLGLRTVAEGVETAGEAQWLTERGWELGQGWLFGRPSPTPQV